MYSFNLTGRANQYDLWSQFKEWLVGLFADMFAGIFQMLADFQAKLVGGVNYIREKLGFAPIEGLQFVDNWAAGAAVPTLPNYGDLFNIGMAAFVMAVILLVTRFVRGFLANIAVLTGIVAGCLVAYFADRKSTRLNSSHRT